MDLSAAVPSCLHATWRPLIRLGIRPYELEKYREWLEVHRAHRLCLSSDDPPELTTILESPERKRLIVAEMRARRTDQEACQAAGTFALSSYCVSCSRCGVSIESGEPELLRQIRDVSLDPSTIDLFLERWGPVLTNTAATWRLMSPVMDPDAEFIHSLARFLREHRGHELAAALSGEGVG